MNIINKNTSNKIPFFCYSEDEQKKQVAVPSGASSTSHKRKKHLRKADTNVLSVRFNRLLQPGN